MNTTIRRRSSLPLSVCAVATLSTTFAYADDTVRTGALEEVVVTAQKREQNLQEVPLPVTAFTAADIERRNFTNIAQLAEFTPNVIFDVGANNGATALSFRRAFPSATVFAFEPVADTFRLLVERTSAQAGIKPFNLALGRKHGRARMRIKSVSVANRISGWRDMLKPSESVTMARGDTFCAEQAIEEIGFLKIDTEGHDLEVLRGFRTMLKAARIDLVEVEVSMNPENRRHVRFERAKSYLERFGYRLFLIHEQAREGAARGPIIRRANVVFCSARLIRSARRG